ncbi:putative olfactory receptor 2I1 [Mustela lutreola]|uniref:putative olfactory receptor 2I1 n=1 Tax=Mustela lutreola TaxID=9666 RepID=UPI002797A271|nr:putative olfactory receptor 2I1 [Mustela lutreola]
MSSGMAVRRGECGEHVRALTAAAGGCVRVVTTATVRRQLCEPEPVLTDRNPADTAHRENRFPCLLSSERLTNIPAAQLRSLQNPEGGFRGQLQPPPPSKPSGSFLPQANHSTGERFLLLGFSDWPALQPGLFALVLLCYLLTLAGNSTLVLLAVRDPRLHTPMYYFLGHLALVYAGFTTSVAPALLASLCGAELWLPRAGCLAQLCTSLALGSVECLLLAVMALDRAAAVVHPLRHAELASPRRCRALACASWLGGLANSAAQSALLAARPLCAPRRLDHFICELPALLQLACGSDRDATERRMFAARVVILLLPSAVILASYSAVAHAICGMRSRGGRSKALGTCGSHLTAVCLFYGSAIYTYLQPTRRYDQGRGKFVSLFYTVVTPALNPLIYTLRNKHVKGAARTLLRSVGGGQAGR